MLPFPAKGFINIDVNFTMATNKMFYHPKRQSVFYLTVTPTNESADYAVYEYNIVTGKHEAYLLKGGLLECKAGRNYGWKQFPNVSYTLDKVVYNFPINSNIYSIDINTKEEKSYGGRSKYTSNLVSELEMPYDVPAAYKHLLENVHFFELQYDNWRDVYYRLHLGNIECGRKTDFMNLYPTKNLYLTTFNSAFEIINEMDLGEGQYDYWNYWGIMKDGFFIVKNLLSSDDENIFQFDIFHML